MDTARKAKQDSRHVSLIGLVVEDRRLSLQLAKRQWWHSAQGKEDIKKKKKSSLGVSFPTWARAAGDWKSCLANRALPLASFDAVGQQIWATWAQKLAKRASNVSTLLDGLEGVKKQTRENLVWSSHPPGRGWVTLSVVALFLKTLRCLWSG